VRYDINEPEMDETQGDAETTLGEALWLSSWIVR
jgi:hypothetical protein